MNSNHAIEVSAAITDALETLRGRRIALIAPAGGVRDERIDAVLRVLGHAGVEAIPGRHIRDHHRYLAGTAAARLADLHAAFARPDIDAVWCLRGGYGSAHLMDGIDWEAIPDHVPLIGHSDITALASAFAARGKQAIHGPVAVDLLRAWGADEAESFAASVASLAPALRGRFSTMTLVHHSGPQQTTCACLWGGNLTVLASIADLRLAPPGDGPITLLLEDVGEAAFRLERCFHQIVRAPWFARVNAVVLGDFYRCALPDGMPSFLSVVQDHVDTDRVSLFDQAPIGHGRFNQAWSLGAPVRISDKPSHDPRSSTLSPVHETD
ncbi:S66 peptidase family protein [Salinisphaera japonica]|uniref:Peptidase S66 n=1 Tax=Salinisphaera japonica YTM-1 TaxID=1209778 RepID=A0A423PNV7_9GAMM|nr:LD-carboxypeptidase [Salinisphaera japonica]ROO27304.1 peptidase S66 [Salinisphaera japonica YTM-1]